MNIRPFTDALRRTYGQRSFIRMFDTKGGGKRHVRFGMLIGVKDGEVDSERVNAVVGDRWLQIDLEENGDHSVWHFIVTTDCKCNDQGPSRIRANTMPTPFTTPDNMRDAIKHEIARTDHPQ